MREYEELAENNPERQKLMMKRWREKMYLREKISIIKATDINKTIISRMKLKLRYKGIPKKILENI